MADVLKPRSPSGALEKEKRKNEWKGRDVASFQQRRFLVPVPSDRWGKGRDRWNPQDICRTVKLGLTSWQTPCPCVPLCADQYMRTYLFLVKSLSSGFLIFLFYFNINIANDLRKIRVR